jgi:uncharacterized protein with FMN-binding domain
MRRIVIAIGTTLTGLVLLFSWPTSLNRAPSATVGGTAAKSAAAAGAAPAAPAAPAATLSDESETGDGAAASAPAAGAAAAAAGSAGTPAQTSTGSKTYDGAAASTQYGAVQVRISVTGGKVSAAQAIAAPGRDPRSQSITAGAVPILNQEAVSAQSASIDMVSGATFTSGGYLQSLQSALDQAGL